MGRPARAGPPATPTVAEPARPITHGQAQLEPLDQGAGAAWQAVALPDTWASCGLPQTGSAHDPLTSALPAVPEDGNKGAAS